MDVYLDIAKVARMSGITSRTLRHYDDIGLLAPATTGADGRRRYGQPELLRLQHILVLRELGTSLDNIARVINTDDASTTITMLRDHLAGLLAERDRFARLAATVARTIDALDKGKPLTAAKILDGFEHEKYEPEARGRWGDDAVDHSNANWERLGDDGKKRHQRIDREIVEALGAAVRVGFAADSAEVQDIVARHHAWLSEIWTPDANAYRSLTQMYVDDERFKAHYDQVAPGAAELLRDAAARYAEHAL